MKGKVVLVGAGPGDPGLLTVRGKALLDKADVVVTDALVNPILWKNLKARIVDVGKRGPGAPQGAHQRKSQATINRMLVRLAQAGNFVVRLKGGDPFIFGRGSEELQALQNANVPFEVVPGVSSAYAVPAYAGIPITDRRYSSHVTILTGHERDEKKTFWSVDWDHLSPHGTLVIFMGVSRWPFIQQQLLKRNWPASQPVAAIESGTTAQQRVLYSQLGNAAKDFSKNKLHAPAIIVIGHVTKLGHVLTWYEKSRPLLGAHVLVMRPQEQASELIQALEEKGADVLHSPGIKIQALSSATTHTDTTRYDFLIFLSANAVRHFTDSNPGNRDQWAGTKVAAVGNQTAFIAEQLGWHVAIKPKLANALALARELGNLKGKRCLVPRAETAPTSFVDALSRRGASVKVLPVYRTKLTRFTASVKREILKKVNMIIFTSTSTVSSFVSNFSAIQRRELLKKVVIVSIGAQTTSALRQCGIRSVTQATNASVTALVDAVVKVSRRIFS